MTDACETGGRIAGQTLGTIIVDTVITKSRRDKSVSRHAYATIIVIDASLTGGGTW